MMQKKLITLPRNCPQLAHRNHHHQGYMQHQNQDKPTHCNTDIAMQYPSSHCFYIECHCDGLFSFIVCWVRYGSIYVYVTELVTEPILLYFFFLLSVNVICDLYFDSHILVVLIITLILIIHIIHIISIKCVYVRECYKYSLTANKSLL